MPKESFQESTEESTDRTPNETAVETHMLFQRYRFMKLILPLAVVFGTYVTVQMFPGGKLQQVPLETKVQVTFLVAIGIIGPLIGRHGRMKAKEKLDMLHETNQLEETLRSLAEKHPEKIEALRAVGAHYGIHPFKIGS